MNDTERLDAIGEYGLTLVTVDNLTSDGWQRRWEVTYGVGFCVHTLNRPTIREAVDDAVADIKAHQQRYN